ncbi:hypothetical protein Q7P37_009169 [Cladosporium fusiforme]
MSTGREMCSTCSSQRGIAKIPFPTDELSVQAPQHPVLAHSHAADRLNPPILEVKRACGDAGDLALWRWKAPLASEICITSTHNSTINTSTVRELVTVRPAPGEQDDAALDDDRHRYQEYVVAQHQRPSRSITGGKIAFKPMATLRGYRAEEETDRRLMSKVMLLTTAKETSTTSMRHFNINQASSGKPRPQIIHKHTVVAPIWSAKFSFGSHVTHRRTSHRNGSDCDLGKPRDRVDSAPQDQHKGHYQMRRLPKPEETLNDDRFGPQGAPTEPPLQCSPQ